jgi:mannose/fructose/sorbose-specific phosphotransferase system IIA component
MAAKEQEAFGILVCTHSALADGFKKAVEMLMGPQEDFETIGLYEGDDILNLSKKITERIKNMKTEKNLIFTDLFGASPTNAAAMSLMDVDASIIAGVNLPLIVELLALRNQHMGFDDLVNDIVNKGRENIRVVTKEMILKGQK